MLFMIDYISYDILNNTVVYNVCIGYSNIKLFFKSYDKVKHVKRICTQIVRYIRSIDHGLKLDAKSIGYDLTNFEVKHFVCHILLIECAERLVSHINVGL